jgi:hypothetical protein
VWPDLRKVLEVKDDSCKNWGHGGQLTLIQMKTERSNGGCQRETAKEHSQQWHCRLPGVNHMPGTVIRILYRSSYLLTPIIPE